MRKYVIAVDFDGTIVEGTYPGIGRDLGGLFWLAQLKGMGCDLVLWTCRAGERLREAEDWLEEHGYLHLFDGLNVQASSVTFFEDDPRKVFANTYIDDRALGAPIKKYVDGRMPDHFDWGKAGPALVKAVAAIQKKWKEAKP